ncbi:type II toxin-antitoxin system Phd/YefM family antitoxin [Thioalkalivibrio nitratireducens]|uniref:type II toxin-antitoxin system Phd/YefM family antitoxin n=1 Tax=Thioalkalivibrio nitratireducens TaxID=186931 RepID=UPI0005C1F76D|nr:type II toxin-antitoxin system prevent-host-death family antitoxin [Thioalkalivibrio nitratireducens]
METVNVHEAKTHLSRLLERVAHGESIVIARAGRPMARLTPMEPPALAAGRRVGFLLGEIQVPDDFDRMGESEIATLFSGNNDPAA